MNIDPALTSALAKASADEQITIIMWLGIGPIPSHPILSPADFPDRTAWRAALLAQQRAVVAAEIADTLQALAALGLWVGGGEISRVVVATGTPGQIAAALTLAGVRQAMLDQPIDLLYHDVARWRTDLFRRLRALCSPQYKTMRKHHGSIRNATDQGYR